MAQRKKVAQCVADAVAVTKQVIHREDNEEYLYYGSEQAADQVERTAGDPACHLS
jgi:hypothetical protein